jgi:hypothetical protein
MNRGTSAKQTLGTPKPGQDVRRHDRDSRASSDTGKSLLRARFSVSERVSADHDCDQACCFGNSSGKEGLDRADASIVATGIMIRMRVIGTSNDQDGRDMPDTMPRSPSRPIHISDTDRCQERIRYQHF